MSRKFDAILRMVKNAKKLDGDKIVKSCLSNTSIQQEILDLNRYDQLYDKGIASDGAFLGEYSAVTIEGTKNFKGKIAKGQRTDHITLSDTFAFYESFVIKPEAHEAIISANTLKPDVDLMTYGKIIGLTTDNKGKVAHWILPQFRNELKSQILKR